MHQLNLFPLSITLHLYSQYLIYIFYQKLICIYIYIYKIIHYPIKIISQALPFTLNQVNYDTIEMIKKFYHKMIPFDPFPS